VDTEKAMLDDSGERHTRERAAECLEDGNRVRLHHFCSKAVSARNLPQFVISAEEIELAGVFNVQCKEKEDTLKRELPSIDIIPEEEIIRRNPVFSENADQIVQAPVDVAHDADGTVEMKDNWPFCEKLSSTFANFDDVLCKKGRQGDGLAKFKDVRIGGREDGLKTAKDAIDNW
jgi:hypothetical protein